MTLFPPGFSERVFEFGFNSEYAAQNRAVLAAAPHIPTQNDEKALGYDVLFEITSRGGAVYSVALQHKTCRFVDTKSGTNKKFWNAAGGPYFAFRLDVEQFNIIESIASSGLPGIAFVYCVPLFTTLNDMNAHYMANTVHTQSIWIDPRGAGTIADSDVHSIIVNAAGSKAFLFSDDPRDLTVTKPRHRTQDVPSSDELTLEIRPTYERVYEAVADSYSRTRRRRRPEESDFHMPSEMPPLVETDGEPELINALGELFSRYVGMSWLIEVKT